MLELRIPCLTKEVKVIKLIEFFFYFLISYKKKMHQLQAVYIEVEWACKEKLRGI